MGATLTDHQQQLLDQLAALRDARERLAWLFARAGSGDRLPAEARNEATQVPGCLARLWLDGVVEEGRCWFRCDSDSRVLRAVAGFVCEYFSGAEPALVAAADASPLARAGLDRVLTANRRDALARVVRRIQERAAELARS